MMCDEFPFDCVSFVFSESLRDFFVLWEFGMWMFLRFRICDFLFFFKNTLNFYEFEFFFDSLSLLSAEHFRLIVRVFVLWEILRIFFSLWIRIVWDSEITNLLFYFFFEPLNFLNLRKKIDCEFALCFGRRFFSIGLFGIVYIFRILFNGGSQLSEKNFIFNTFERSFNSIQLFSEIVMWYDWSWNHLSQFFWK